MTVVVGLLLVLLVVLVIGGFVGVIVLVFRASGRQRARRTAEAGAYATARGFRHTSVDRTLPDRFTGPPFRRGAARVATDVVQGSFQGRPVIAFAYRFTTGSGDNRHHHLFGVVSTALPTAVPRLEVARRSTMGTFLDAFGGGDHEIGDPAFDAAYRVFTDSPPFAADVLGPELRAWLMAQQPPLLYLRGNDLVVVDRGRPSPTEIDRRLAFAAGFLDRVPEPVWQRAGGRLL